LKKYNLILSN